MKRKLAAKLNTDRLDSDRQLAKFKSVFIYSPFDTPKGPDGVIYF
jgi:hypothetical protein